MGITVPTLQSGTLTEIIHANTSVSCLAHYKYELLAIISIINTENEWEEFHQNANRDYLSWVVRCHVLSIFSFATLLVFFKVSIAL